MASNLLLAIMVVPLMLVVILAVATQFSTSTQSQFEGNAITNENMGNVTGATTTLYPVYQIKDDATAACKIVNGTTDTTLTATSNPSGTCAVYALAGYSGYTVATTNVTDTGAVVYMNYTPYSKAGYVQFGKVIQQTYAGFNLGALLPFILIAMAIVGIIVGLMAI